MTTDTFWTDLREEIQSESVVNHPIYIDLVNGALKPNTLAELCAQLKHTVEEGISSLSLIIPQAPRHTRMELAENLFGELTGTPEVPSHWELAIRAGAAAGFSEEDVDARPMIPETKVYPDTVSAYAMRGRWVEALSFVSMGIEDMFTEFCDGVTKGPHRQVRLHRAPSFLLRRTRRRRRGPRGDRLDHRRHSCHHPRAEGLRTTRSP